MPDAVPHRSERTPACVRFSRPICSKSEKSSSRCRAGGFGHGTAYESFASADIELAQEVIAEDAKIDFLQNQLDERAIDVLALQGPVASDLRMIVGSLRMSASLERMGDLARHVAQLARLRFPQQVVPESIAPTFKAMAELDIAIAGKVGESARHPRPGRRPGNHRAERQDRRTAASHLQGGRRTGVEPLRADDRRCHPDQPLPGALRRPRGLRGPQGHLPGHRRMGPGHHRLLAFQVALRQIHRNRHARGPPEIRRAPRARPRWHRVLKRRTAAPFPGTAVSRVHRRLGRR